MGRFLNRWRICLEKCVQILGDESLSLKEYMEILEAGFGEIQVGVIPPTLGSGRSWGFKADPPWGCEGPVYSGMQ